MELQTSLHRVGSDLVNSYLVVDDRGVTVIDAGLPGQWSDLKSELALLGRTPDDIRGVILTHGDSDHLGFAERLRRDHGVTVYVHERDAQRARGETGKKNPSWGKVKVGPLLQFLWYAGVRGGMKTISVTEVTEIVDGQVLDLPGSPRVIHTPGHSPGSICIHVPAVGAVFVGDALTTRHVLTGREGPQPAPFTLDPSRALDSLSRLTDLEVTWVLPGHGPPWRGGAAEAVSRIRQVAAEAESS